MLNTRTIVGVVALATAVLTITPTRASAQVAASATCVGGAIGCSQVDFFFTLLGGPPLEVSELSLTLTSPGWLFQFPAFVEAEDVDGLFAFNTIFFSATSVTGVLEPVPSVLDVLLNPTLRIRTEFSAHGDNLDNFGLDAMGRTTQDVLAFDVSLDAQPGTVVPEPSTAALTAVALFGLALARRRRRSC